MTLIDSQKLPRRIGQSVDFGLTVPVTDSSGYAVLRVPQPVDVMGSATLVDDGIYIDMNVAGLAQGECVRCLEPVERPFSYHVRELFVEPELRSKAIEEGDEEAADWFTIDKNGVDLEAAVVDVVIGGMDPRPLCDDDCPGLCDQCGENLRDDPEHIHEVIDTRWAGLKELRDSL